MQYFALAAALPLLAAAAPTATTPPSYGPGPTPSSAPSPADKFKKFALKVHVPDELNPSCHEKFEGGYLGPYHTGAGMNDVTAYFDDINSSEKSFFINGTSLQADLQPGVTPYFPWTVSVPGDTNYAAFEPARLNAGLVANQYGRYFINETGLQFTTVSADSSYDTFAGWVLCDWIHGVPQLFQRVASFGGYPKNCEQVELQVEYQ